MAKSAVIDRPGGLRASDRPVKPVTSCAGNNATVEVMLAARASMPVSISDGRVMNEPPPASAFCAPAQIDATKRMASDRVICSIQAAGSDRPLSGFARSAMGRRSELQESSERSLAGGEAFANRPAARRAANESRGGRRFAADRIRRRRLLRSGLQATAVIRSVPCAVSFFRSPSCSSRRRWAMRNRRARFSPLSRLRRLRVSCAEFCAEPPQSAAPTSLPTTVTGSGSATSDSIPNVTMPGEAQVGQALPQGVTPSPMSDRPGYGRAIVNGHNAIVDTNSNQIVQFSD